MTSWLRTLAALAVLAVAVVAGLAHMAPPAPRPASAPPDVFSAERAMRPLASIASHPHPTGTPADSAVRAEIVALLTTLGFDVTVQDATVVNDGYARWGWPVVAGHVRNVVARKAGTAAGPAVLLTAHYDSRELAPGASDDGYGTAALLETARALSVSPPLRHDVMLLFTEGEEQGLLGARAFVEESPLARDVAVALNVDCRGDRGPGVMFETGDDAADLIETLGRVAPGITAASLSQEVYRRMPNDTDLTVWLRAGHAGMNFGNIDGFERYHQPTDTLRTPTPGPCSRSATRPSRWCAPWPTARLGSRPRRTTTCTSMWARCSCATTRATRSRSPSSRWPRCSPARSSAGGARG